MPQRTTARDVNSDLVTLPQVGRIVDAPRYAVLVAVGLAGVRLQRVGNALAMRRADLPAVEAVLEPA